MCSLLPQTERKQTLPYLYIPLILLGIYPGDILEMYRLPSSFLYIATSISRICVTCCSLLIVPHAWTFALLLPSSSYLQNPQISLCQNGGIV